MRIKVVLQYQYYTKQVNIGTTYRHDRRNEAGNPIPFTSPCSVGEVWICLAFPTSPRRTGKHMKVMQTWNRGISPSWRFSEHLPIYWPLDVRGREKKTCSCYRHDEQKETREMPWWIYCSIFGAHSLMQLIVNPIMLRRMWWNRLHSLSHMSMPPFALIGVFIRNCMFNCAACFRKNKPQCDNQQREAVSVGVKSKRYYWCSACLQYEFRRDMLRLLLIAVFVKHSGSFLWNILHILGTDMIGYYMPTPPPDSYKREWCTVRIVPDLLLVCLCMESKECKAGQCNHSAFL